MNKHLQHIILGFAICLLSLNAVSQTTPEEEALLDKMFPNLIMRREYREPLIEDINKKGMNPAKTWYITNVRNPADNLVNNDVKPTPFVSLKNNPEEINAQTNMANIRQLCIAYLITLDAKYRDKAVEYLSEWAKINVAVPRYNIHESVYWEGIEGYSIIRNTIDENSRQLIDSWITKRITVYTNNPDLRDNNWGTCLLYQYLSAGLLLNNQTYLNYFNKEYPVWVKGNLYPNGTTTDLIGRDAFAYHAYDLLFFAKMCHAKAMYEGYDKADEFYTKDVNWGASIKKCVDFWKPFLLYPDKYTHIEFRETEWSGDKNRGDYNKTYSPGGTVYAVDELYEMDKDLIQVINKYRGGNQFSTWKLGISSLRWYYTAGEE